MKVRRTLTTTAIALLATITPLVVAASPAAAAPAGCTLVKMDGGRTSAATCKPGSWIHYARCANADSNWYDYTRPFTQIDEISCPGSTRVAYHSISAA